MQLGAMNNPMRDPAEEIERIAKARFEFVDLTLEPSAARSDRVDVARVAKALRETGLGAVGHTAFFLPIASSFDSLRECAFQEMLNSLLVFRDLGIAKVNIHPDWKVVLHDNDWVRGQNIEALCRLAEAARGLGQTILVENLFGAWTRADFLRPIFAAVPELRFHLDLGHANLDGPVNRAEELLHAFGRILEHVHVSDNYGGTGGGDDLHLPIGAGRIDWPKMVGLLKRAGYDGTITLEIFSRDQDYLYISREKFGRMWEEQTSS